MKKFMDSTLFKVLGFILMAVCVAVLVFVFIDALSPADSQNTVNLNSEPTSNPTAAATSTKAATPQMSWQKASLSTLNPTPKPTPISTPKPTSIPTLKPVSTLSVIVPADNITKTVYVTNTGSKYHRSGCQYLHSSCIPIDLDRAINQGYSPCSKCY